MVGAIVVELELDLAADGVATLGEVPSGLPNFGFPSVTWARVRRPARHRRAIFIVILAQSAATSRAYAAKYEEPFDENVDLVGLGLGERRAGLSGTFVVNGSPTKTQMVDGAGGKSQLASSRPRRSCSIVLLFLTKPLQYMPNGRARLGRLPDRHRARRHRGAARDPRGSPRRVRHRRHHGCHVIVVGVEQAIVVAIVVSVIDHLRRSYRPNDAVVVPSANGNELKPPAPGTRTSPGLVIYRFAASLYYANASRFSEQVLDIVSSGDPVQWFCVDAEAISMSTTPAQKRCAKSTTSSASRAHDSSSPE